MKVLHNIRAQRQKFLITVYIGRHVSFDMQYSVCLTKHFAIKTFGAVDV
jgi:hypothetical protein